jgi:hypothetical protein
MGQCYFQNTAFNYIYKLEELISNVEGFNGKNLLCKHISPAFYVTRQDTRASRCTSLVRLVLNVIQTDRGRLVFVNQ